MRALLCALMLFAAPALHAACNEPAGPKVDWSGCSKERLILKDKDLQDAKFVRAIFLGMNFASAKLSRADFSSAEFNHVSFRDAQLDGANFEKSVAVRSNFSGARLDGANLEKAELHRSLLAKASLKKANLVPADSLRAKIVLSGSIKSAVTVTGVGVSKGARAAIEAAGGKVEAA